MKRYFAWGAAILAAAGAASLVAALPAQVAYCTLCGKQQHTHALGLRFTSVTLFRSEQISSTPFSQVLVEKHLVPEHRHQWQTPQLVPNPLNEFGPPVIESVGYLNAPRVVNFTRNVADYADPASLARWQELIIRPNYPREIDAALRYLRVPEEGFSDRTAFLNWWGNNYYSVYNRLREMTEPD